MFWHNFKYSFKALFRDKMLIFWTFAFPILLGIFFNMAFKDIEKNEQLSIIDIAIVNNDYFENNELIKQTFNSLSNPTKEEQIFNVNYVNEKEAKELLNDKKVSGYIIFAENDNEIYVKESGINATVIKSVVDEITSTNEIIKNSIIEEVKNYPNFDPTQYSSMIYEKTIEMLNKDLNIKDISASNLSFTMIEYYTLIAMSCLYGGILGMIAINNLLPNMSSKGKRVAVTPMKKGSMILSSVLASYIVQLLGTALLLLFLYFIIKVDFGTHLILIILLAMVGSLSGLSLGVIIASLLKSNEGVKTGILLSVTMFGCFLSGMMGITMKYIIDKNIPLINKLNPANMITDGFYSLYYYDSLNRYWFNIISLLIFASILLIISSLVLRRQKYDNI